MKHNAYAVNRPMLWKQWGDDTYPPTITVTEDTPVMVVWSPIHRQWIMSITTQDYRYDGFVTEHHFRRDHTLTAEEFGPAYYLDQAKRSTSK